MSYSIVFTGEIKASVTRDQAIENLALLFKKDTTAIEKLFTGNKLIIKRGLDHQSAIKYQMALANAGIVTELLDTSVENNRHSTYTAQATTSNPLTVAEAGMTIMEPMNTPEPSIDISALSMSDAGITLVEPVPVTADNIEPPSLNIAPTGAILSDDKPPASPAIDTSGMSIAEVGSRILDNDK